MCYFDQIQWPCGYWKWGNFRQHCTKEYPIGETCGLKLVYETHFQPGKCRLCEQIDKKERRYNKMAADVQRWRMEGGRPASIEKAESDMEDIRIQMRQLYMEHSGKGGSGMASAYLEATARSQADASATARSQTDTSATACLQADASATARSQTDASATISEKSAAIRTCLERLTSPAFQTPARPARTPAALHDVYCQFVLWTGTMGSVHRPSSKLSLERRLSDAPEVLRHFHRLLDDLLDAVVEVTSLLLGLPLGPIDDPLNARHDNNPPVELEAKDELEDPESLVDEISDTLKGLFRAGMLVRKAAARDRFAHALAASTPGFSAQFDIDYVEQKFSKLGRLGDRSARLVQRLGKANSKRRQVQKYYRDHNFHLAAGKGAENHETSTEKLSSKATTLAPAGLEKRFGEDDGICEGDHDEVSSVTTAVTTFGKAGSLSLPRLANLSPDGEPLICPICFVLCSFRTEKAWKIHALADIRPYVCTLGGAECEELIFPDRNSWFTHELGEHRAWFTCAVCAAAGFSSETLFRDHLSTHEGCSAERTEDLVAAGRKIGSDFTADDCLFCDEWMVARSQLSGSGAVTGPQLKRHVATHLEQLALFAVPCAMKGDGGAEPSAGSANSGVSTQRLGVGMSEEMNSRRAAVAQGSKAEESSEVEEGQILTRPGELDSGLEVPNYHIPFRSPLPRAAKLRTKEKVAAGASRFEDLDGASKVSVSGISALSP